MKTEYDFDFPPGEILDACIDYAEKLNRIAEVLESGMPTGGEPELPSTLDTGTLLAHLRVLREDIPIFVEGVRAASGKPQARIIKGLPLADRPDATAVERGTLFDATDASLYESDGRNWHARIRRV